jgi:predicted HTH domain antitoxin
LKLKEANDNLYESEEKAISDALELLLKENPEYRMKLALYRYQHEEISIGKAAQIAGVPWQAMREELNKNDIPLRLAPRTIEEARKDCEVARKLMDERNRK